MDNERNTPESKVEEAQPAYDMRYTYSDYLQWDDDKRRELIDGIPYLMAGPNRRHQELSANLNDQFRAFLKGKSCKVYYAPFDVRLNAGTRDDIVVQPDLIIVCDHSMLDDASCKGAPDMIIEILSPSTANYDKTTKFETYLKAGIKEYWIVDPVTQTLAIHILSNDNYITHVYTEKETAPVHVLEGCHINLSEVFAE